MLWINCRVKLDGPSDFRGKSGYVQQRVPDPLEPYEAFSCYFIWCPKVCMGPMWISLPSLLSDLACGLSAKDGGPPERLYWIRYTRFSSSIQYSDYTVTTIRFKLDQSFVIACKPLSPPTRIIYPRSHYNALMGGITAIDRTWGSRGPVQSTRLSQVTIGPSKR